MKTFWIKLLDFALIFVGILTFNGIVNNRKEAEELAQAEFEEAQAAAQTSTVQENAISDSTTTESTEVSTASVYQDGTYEGEAQGYGGLVVVEIVLANDTITQLQVVSAEGEDQAYLEAAMGVVDAILLAQSTDVDTVSGATFSSKGIIGAVEDALEKAVNPS